MNRKQLLEYLWKSGERTRALPLCVTQKTRAGKNKVRRGEGGNQGAVTTALQKTDRAVVDFNPARQ